MNLILITLHQKLHHFGGIFTVIKTYHSGVKVEGSCNRDADRVEAVQHQPTIHHITTGAFITIEEKLEISAKKEHSQRAFKRRQGFDVADTL